MAKSKAHTNQNVRLNKKKFFIALFRLLFGSMFQISHERGVNFYNKTNWNEREIFIFLSKKASSVTPFPPLIFKAYCKIYLPILYFNALWYTFLLIHKVVFFPLNNLCKIVHYLSYKYIP